MCLFERRCECVKRKCIRRRVESALGGETITNILFLERGNGKMKHSRTICLVIDYTDWRVDSGNHWNLSGCSAIARIRPFQRDRSQDLFKSLQITDCPLFIQRKCLLHNQTQKLQLQPSASRSLPPSDGCTPF